MRRPVRHFWLSTALCLGVVLTGCATAPPAPTAYSPKAVVQTSEYLLFRSGDTSVQRREAVQPGVLLVGGGDWPADGFRWWFKKAGHGHVVVLRASFGGEQGREMVERIGGVASATTIVFRSRRAASDPALINLIEHADAIFISGGDQANYVRFWKDTAVQQALNQHVAQGKPIGGTSAGLAILGKYAYGAMDGGSLTSQVALANPAGPALTIVEDFLHVAPLYDAGVITDTHFSKRGRQGRLIGLMARVKAMHPDAQVLGLAVDEDAVLGIDGKGEGHVFGPPTDHAWLFIPGQSTVVAGRPLSASQWRVQGIGAASTLRALPGAAWRVEAPIYEGTATVIDGQLQLSPQWPTFAKETPQ